MKPLKILIDVGYDYPLTLDEIKYCFKTLLTIAGLPWNFVASKSGKSIDIFFGSYHSRINTKLFIQNNATVADYAKKEPSVITNKNIAFLEFSNYDKDRKIIDKSNNQTIKIFNDSLFALWSKRKVY